MEDNKSLDKMGQHIEYVYKEEINIKKLKKDLENKEEDIINKENKDKSEIMYLPNFDKSFFFPKKLLNAEKNFTKPINYLTDYQKYFQEDDDNIDLLILINTMNANKGTLDCILCGDNSVPNAAKMMSEIYRLLAPGGHYMVITYGDPEVRKKYLETQQWASLSVDKLAKPSAAVSATLNADENDVKNFHYVYTMAKPK